MGGDGRDDDGPGGLPQQDCKTDCGVMAQRGDGGEREWALVNVALEVTDIWPIRKYLQRRQAKRAEYVKGRTIYKLCTGPDRI